MTLLIQRVEHRDTQAVHAKLDELLKSDARARTELAAIDKRDPEEIELHLAGGQESPQLTVLAKVAEVHSLLSSDGRGIEVAANGLTAREQLNKTQYDLLILDINLPFRDGDEPDRRGGMNLLTEG